MTRNPFTPGLTIAPEKFVGRKEEIRVFTKSLTQSFYGNPQNLAIMGDRGIGKSSLLRKFESIAKEKECLVVRRDMDASVNSIQMLAYFILSAMRGEGKRFFSRSKKARNSVSGFFSKYTISFSVAGFGGTIEGKAPVVAIQEEFYSELAKISENIQKHTPVIVIMLDEAEHLQNIEGAWGFLRSVFTRLVENGHHFFVIVSGKLGLFKDIKEIFSPMERFFFPRGISVFNSEETIEAIEKPMTENHVSIVDEVKRSIAEYTDGHPFIVQVFGFYLFELGEKAINNEIFQRELPNIFERLRVQVFQDRYYSASRKEKMVLDFMSSSEKSVFRPLEIGNSLKIKNPSQLMHRLVEKDCLRKVGYGEYTLFHKLFKQFIRVEKEAHLGSGQKPENT